MIKAKLYSLYKKDATSSLYFAEGLDNGTMAESHSYVINAIRQGKQNLKKLMATVAPEKEKALLDAIRGMLDAKEIYYQNPGQLQINESSKPPR